MTHFISTTPALKNTLCPPTAVAVFGYVRVSTDRQDLSLDAQTAGIQRAADYHEFGPVQIIAEPATSGALPFRERPQGRALIERFRNPQSEVSRRPPGSGLRPPASDFILIVPKVDRLGRDTVDVSQTVTLLESLGVRVLFLDINVDTRTPMGRAFMQIAAVFAELELARITERIQTALDHKRSQGMLTGTEPYGWDAPFTGVVSGKGVAERRLHDNHEQQAWILHMLRLRQSGWSLEDIARDLNQRGVPAKRGGQWQFGNVSKVLNNKTVREWLAQRVAAGCGAPCG